MLQVRQASFDEVWGTMDEDTRTFVLEKTEAIRARMKRTAEDVIAIGQDLLAVKERLDHGLFLDWLQAEFEMSQPSAWRFMQAARRFADKSFTVNNFSLQVLYELAAPSTPEEVIEQVTSGQIPASLPAIREAKAALLPPMEPIATPVVLPSGVLVKPAFPPPVLPPPPTDDAYATVDAIRQMEAETEREAELETGYAIKLYMRGRLLDFQKFSDELVTNAITSSDRDDVADLEAICDEAIAWLSHVKELIHTTRKVRLL